MNPHVTALSKHEETIITVDVRPDGVAVITMNDMRETFNTITRRFGEELRDAFDRVARDTYIRAAVIVSGKPDSFVVGANIDMIRGIKLAVEAERLSSLVAAGLRQMRAGEKPFVAAVHGQALGGGFEIALACHAIVASDDAKTSFGLPEVQLGLIPAANGLFRIAERAGLETAIDLGLTGRNLRAPKAKAMGLVDEVCPRPVLMDVAVERARALSETKERPLPRKRQNLSQWALERNPIGRALLFKRARAEMMKKTHGHYPAAERIVELLECFATRGNAAAAELEAKSFGELVVSETAHRLIEIFFATTALKKDKGVDDPTVVPMPVEHVGILGAGLMGAGIAYVTAGLGIAVRMKDKDDLGVGRGLKTVHDLLDERVRKKQLRREDKDQTFARVTGTVDMSGFKQSDIVIEAVFEDLALKRRVLTETEEVIKDSCIYASNTSSIPIREIARSSKRPENVVGMHYFSPAHKMPLLEVIQTERTSPRVVATCVALGKKQGKTVIVVNDGPGFYTSRILAPYLNEATYLVTEGVPIEAVDYALVDWGWPVGPIQLLDEVGIDVALHVGPILFKAFGARLATPPAMDKLVGDDRKGRKNRRGFYRYDLPLSKRRRRSPSRRRPRRSAPRC